MIFHLSSNQLVFPDPKLADPDGLLAIGGDLSVERLKLAYESGIFPWFSEGDPILWYAPHERCVIFPERIKVSKTMRKLIRDNYFSISENQAFADVIHNCAKIPRKDQRGTWITQEMQAVYIRLNMAGLAKSIEVWDDKVLVGGLYGVVVGGIFCGESMFSKVSNASKLALIHLSRSTNVRLIDCQIPNDHLLTLGAELIAQQRYMEILKDGLTKSAYLQPTS